MSARFRVQLGNTFLIIARSKRDAGKINFNMAQFNCGTFSKSIMSTMLFYSNIQFLDETGYFATASELKPLLHTWSLAVEEQFYIVFPLLMAGVWAVWKKAIKPAVVLFFLASFVGCIILTDMRQVYAFFLSPTRAWELALGSLIAMNIFPQIKTRGVREALSASGLGLILFAILGFDASTHFPSYLALVPALAAGINFINILIGLFHDGEKLI